MLTTKAGPFYFASQSTLEGRSVLSLAQKRRLQTRPNRLHNKNSRLFDKAIYSKLAAKMTHLSVAAFCILLSTNVFALGKKPLNDLPDPNTLPVLVGAAENQALSFSPQNDYLVFINHNKDLQSYQISTQQSFLLSRAWTGAGDSLQHFMFLPDGQHIVFAVGSTRSDDSKLFVSKLDGSAMVTVSERLDQTNFSDRKILSADRKSLLFRERQSGNAYRLVRYDLATQTSTEIKPSAAGDWNVLYFNSSATGQIALIAKESISDARGLFWAAAGDANAALLPLPNSIRPNSARQELGFSPDIESILFSSDDAVLFFLSSRVSVGGGPKTFDLYSYAIGAQLAAPLSDPSDIAGVRAFWLHEKSSRVIFLAGLSQNSLALWSSRSDGQEKVRLHPDSADYNGIQASSVIVSQNSSTIYFHSNSPVTNGQQAVFLNRVDGSFFRRFDTTNLSADQLGTPLSSSVGDIILLSGIETTGPKTNLFAISPSRQEITQLNREGPRSRLGNFQSQSNGQVLFTSTNTDDRLELFLVDLPSSTRLRISHATAEISDIGNFSLSSNGETVAYITRSAGVSNLWLRAVKTAVANLLPAMAETPLETIP